MKNRTSIFSKTVIILSVTILITGAFFFLESLSDNSGVEAVDMGWIENTDQDGPENSTDPRSREMQGGVTAFLKPTIFMIIPCAITVGIGGGVRKMTRRGKSSRK